MLNILKNTHGGKRDNAGRKPTGKETVVIRVDKLLLPEIERLKINGPLVIKAAHQQLIDEVNQLRDENAVLKNQLEEYRSKYIVKLAQDLEIIQQHLKS